MDEIEKSQKYYHFLDRRGEDEGKELINSFKLYTLFPSSHPVSLPCSWSLEMIQ